MSSEVMTLTNKPIIDYSGLDKVAKEVDDKISKLKLDKIEPTEENVKTLKDIRAGLNKDKTVYEESRKSIKKLVLAPYEQFELEYKNKILKKFEDADQLLKNGIDSIEGKLKIEKQKELESFFKETCIASKIDFIKFEHVGLNITLSASLKSLKEQITTYIEKIQKDLEYISLLDNRERILVKYRKSLNLSASLLEVKQEDELSKVIIEPKEEKIEKPDVIEEIIKITFTVTGTLTQLKAMKKYLIDNHITYE